MNLTIDISNQVEIRNAITLLESLIEKTKTAAATPALPKNFPKPPKGFIYAGVGPLRFPDGCLNKDIAKLCGWAWDTSGWSGTFESHYALRAGSEIAKLNGL
jgi:hypothetical protein